MLKRATIVFFFAASLLAACPSRLVLADDGIFYLAPKMIQGRHDAGFSEGGGMTITSHDSWWQGTSPPGSYHFPMPGGKSKQNSTLGALAFGIDLYPRWRLPVRVEVEASTATRQTTIGPMSTPYFEDNQGTPQWSAQSGQNLRYRAWNQPDSTGYRLHTLFFNFFADWHTGFKFTPYIGGGLGFSYVKLHFDRRAFYAVSSRNSQTQGINPDPSGTNTATYTMSETKKIIRAVNFAWNFAVGCSYNFYDDVAVDLSYRYTNIGFSEEVGLSPSTSTRFTGYTHSTIFTIKDSHQVVLGLRFSFYKG